MSGEGERCWFGDGWCVVDREVERGMTFYLGWEPKWYLRICCLKGADAKRERGTRNEEFGVLVKEGWGQEDW